MKTYKGMDLAPILAALLIAAVARAQDVVGPAAEGVYSAEQAARGKTVVENHCASCHGGDLTGLEGPALVGAGFMLKWEPRQLDMLFSKIRDTMPPDEVTSVADDEKLDATAYLLQQNGFPEGTAELTGGLEKLARIPLSRQVGGAAAVRTGSLVRVTGCLSQDARNGWMLTAATEPRAATIAAAQKPTDVAPLGTQTVQLLNVFPDPSAHKGHNMEATGLLVRNAAGDGVNVMSLEMLGPTCGK